MAIRPELTPRNISHILNPIKSEITCPFICQIDLSLDLEGIKWSLRNDNTRIQKV